VGFAIFEVLDCVGDSEREESCGEESWRAGRVDVDVDEAGWKRWSRHPLTPDSCAVVGVSDPHREHANQVIATRLWAETIEEQK